MNKPPIPPADGPDWDGPYNFGWFKFHHLENLKIQSQALTNFYIELPKGEPLTQENISDLFVLTDSFIEFLLWLQDYGGGQGDMKDVIKYCKKIKKKFQGKPANTDSYWTVQEIKSTASGIVNYINAMCEDE